MWNSRMMQRDLLRFFRDHAERVQWYAAAQCPCITTATGSANPNCQACGGVGFYYPTAPQALAVVLTNVKQAIQLTPEGWALPGEDTVADFAPGAHLPAYGDLIWPTWRQGEPFAGQMIQRGTDAADRLWYTATTIEQAASVDPTTGVSTFYTLGVDFTVHGKTVTWLGTSNQPAAGTFYTLRYNAQFEWVVFAPPQVRVERGTSLGPRAILRKRHLILPNAPGVLQG